MKRWRPSIPTEQVAEMNEVGETSRREFLALGLPAEPMYYDRDGNPMMLGDWAEAHNDFDYRRVAQTMVGHVEVSTVWLGIDHNYVDGGPPIIFETMCFVYVGGERVTSDDDEMRRYSTEQQALAGHAEVVAQLQADLHAD